MMLKFHQLVELNSKSFIVWLLFFVNQLNQISCIDDVKCPEVCQRMSCVINVLSCQQFGMKSIPHRIPNDITKVLYVNQIFNISKLNKDLFVNYLEIKIAKLAIINCSITYVYPQTFKGFKYLSNLDLSKNKVTRIDPGTFDSLNVKYLRLSQNPLKKLHRDSFKGLTITDKLNLEGCQLEDINIETFKPIMGSLQRLDIAGNKLKTIQLDFRKPFNQLAELQLGLNPYSCNCKNKWLVEMLKQRKKVKKSTDEPKCNQPPSLKNSKISSLSNAMFICTKPELLELDITIYNASQAKLSCFVKDDTLDGFQVYWYKNIKSHNRIIQHKRIQQSSSRPIITYKNTESSILIKRTNSQLQDTFITHSCVASNSNGNNSAEIHINWPKSSQHKISTQRTIYTNNNQFSNKNSRNKKNDSIFDKRFTLLEMIIAVVATFTITLLLFFSFYRVIICKIREKQRDRKRKLYETVQYSDSQTYDIPQNHTIPIKITNHPLKMSSNNLTTTLANNNTKTPINTNNSSLPRPMYNRTSPLNNKNTSNNNNLPYYHPIQSNPIVTPNPYHQHTLPNSNNYTFNSPIHYLDFKNSPQIINNDHITNNHNINDN